MQIRATQFILHTCRPTHDTLHFPLQIVHLTICTPNFPPRTTLYPLHFTLYTSLHTLTLLFTHYTVQLHFTRFTPHSTLYAFQRGHSTLSFAVRTFLSYFTFSAWHSTLCPLHTSRLALHTLNSILCTVHPTLYNLHFTLHTLRFALYTLRSTLYTVHFIRSTLCTLRSTLYAWHFALHTLDTPHFTLDPLRSIFQVYLSQIYNLYLALHTPAFRLDNLYACFTSHFDVFTVHIFHSTPCTGPNTLHCTLYAPNYTLHFALCAPYSTLWNQSAHSALQH